MEDEVKLSMKYMESVNYSPNLPPAQFPKNNIIEKKKTAKYKENMGRGTETEGKFPINF